MNNRKKSPMFKVGDVVWYISEWDETNTPRKGKITDIRESDCSEGEITTGNTTEYVYFDEQYLSKTKNECLSKFYASEVDYFEREIQKSKKYLKEAQDNLKKHQSKLAKLKNSR